MGGNNGKEIRVRQEEMGKGQGRMKWGRDRQGGIIKFAIFKYFARVSMNCGVSKQS